MSKVAFETWLLALFKICQLCKHRFNIFIVYKLRTIIFVL